MKKPDELKEETKDLQQLNPQVMDVQIGIHDLRTIKLYPLSVGDQMKMTSLLGETIASFVASKEAKDEVRMIGFFIKIVNSNLARFLGLATCEEPEGDKYPKAEVLLCDITNLQASNIAEAIYVMNYETSIKNFQSLFEKVKKLFPSERSLQQSAKDTLTDLETSLESPSEKEDLQETS